MRGVSCGNGPDEAVGELHDAAGTKDEERVPQRGRPLRQQRPEARAAADLVREVVVVAEVDAVLRPNKTHLERRVIE